MGTGNYIPRDDNWQNVFFFYVEKEDCSGMDDPAEWAYQEWDDLLDTINFVVKPHTYQLNDTWTSSQDAMLIIAENGHYQVAVKDEDVHFVVAVGVIHQLGDRSAMSMEHKLMKHLSDCHYTLSRRTGPWTSRRVNFFGL